MYNDIIKTRAYTLFLQGFTAEKIAELVKKDFALAKLSGATVKNWAEKNDWDQSRREVRTAMMKSSNESQMLRTNEIRQKMQTITEQLYTKLVESAPPAKSMEGMSYALKTIAEFELELDERSRQQFHPIHVVQMLLELFNSIPGVRREIKANWPQIRKALMELLGTPENMQVLAHEEHEENSAAE